MKQFIIGGAVRDVLLGKVPHDIDFVWVGATPADMLANGMTRVGQDFPVFLDANGNEHALARKERKIGTGYNGFDCTFDTSVTLRDDQFRRDITINQLAVDVDDWDTFQQTLDRNLVIDSFGGEHDLQHSIIRHISPHFAEDPLRVLRVARFRARYDFVIHDDTMVLMMDLVQKNEMENIVAERVWTETEKALNEKHNHLFFETLHQAGALERLFPKLTVVDTGPLRNVTIRNKPMVERVMALFVNTDDLSSEHAVDMLLNIKAPSHVISAVSKFLVVLHECWHAELSTPKEHAGHLLSILKKIDAFRQDDLAHIVSVSDAIGGDIKSFIDELFVAFHAAKDIRFDDIPPGLQSTLRGPEIGIAIDNIKVQSIQEDINTGP
jgi:tRNA nucleotidyltransferase/poly(A) polymerase